MARDRQTGTKKHSSREAKPKGPVKRPAGYDLRFATRGGSIGLKDGTTLKVIETIKSGLPYSSIDTFHKFTDLPVQTIAEAVQIPPRTLIRRKAKGKLAPDESERLLRMSNVFERAVELFEGDRAAAMRWLRTPQPALGNATPFDFARTEVGAREVEDVIGRLEHGVYT
jgi:putative toxin-antitoxin system antitoxin component (TIGR02293 family)